MSIIRIRVIFITIITCFFISACEPLNVAMSLRQQKQSVSQGEVDGYFTGIKDIVRRKRVVNVMINHGMGPSKPLNYADKDIIPRIAKALAFDGDAPDTMRVWEGPSSIKVTEYRKNRAILRFFAIHWSDITLPAKSFLAYNEGMGANQNIGAPMNANKLLKEYILDQSMADLIVYTNPAGRIEMQRPVEKAIKLMVLKDPLAFLRSEKEEPDEKDIIEDYEVDNYENIMVLKSLGAKITFDVMSYLMHDEYQPYHLQRFSETSGKVYLFSNQLPLINLMNYSFSDQLNSDQKRITYFNNDSIYSNVRMFTKFMVKDVQLVSFRDPEDIFCYKLPKGLLNYDGKVINVSVHNSAKKMSANLNIDDIKKKVEATDPYTAHESYEANPLLIDLMVNGCGPRDITNGTVKISTPDPKRKTETTAQVPKLSDLFFYR